MVKSSLCRAILKIQDNVLMGMCEWSPYKHMSYQLSKLYFLSAGTGSLATALIVWLSDSYMYKHHR